jgi:Protein of unknown function (DUF2878)
MGSDMSNSTLLSSALQTRHSWINFLLFQGVYTLSLVGVINNVAWIGSLGLAAFAIWHARTAQAAKTDFLLAGIAVVVGLALDTLYMRSGLIAYSGELFWTGIAPLWILVLWANFALTLGGCLSWLRGRLALAALLAATGGPLSYYAGIRLGTATISGDPLVLFSVISVTWGIAVPGLLWLSMLLEQQRRWREPLLPIPLD